MGIVQCDYMGARVILNYTLNVHIHDNIHVSTWWALRFSLLFLYRTPGKIMTIYMYVYIHVYLFVYADHSGSFPRMNIHIHIRDTLFCSAIYIESRRTHRSTLNASFTDNASRRIHSGCNVTRTKDDFYCTNYYIYLYLYSIDAIPI